MLFRGYRWARMWLGGKWERWRVFNGPDCCTYPWTPVSEFSDPPSPMSDNEIIGQEDWA